MRILVCGDREWTDYNAILKELKYYNELYKVSFTIEGEARGADSLARVAAEQLKIPVMKFPADWDKHGKAAGPIRNQQMLDEGKPDLVLAFHDNIEQSKGTKHMIEISKKKGLRVLLFKHKIEMVEL